MRMRNVLVAMFLSSLASFAQVPDNTSGDTLKVDVTKLTQQELTLYQSLKKKEAVDAGNILDKMIQLKESDVERYAAIGKAFGTAFKECWSAVSDDAEKFAQSDAGKLTMFLVAWKIMANDMLLWSRFAVAVGVLLFFLFIIFPVWFWSYKRHCVSCSILKTKESTGKLPWQYNKTFVTTNPDGDASGWHFMALLVLMVVAAIFVACLI